MADQPLSLDTFADGRLLEEVRESMALLGAELSREDIAGKGKVNIILTAERVEEGVMKLAFSVRTTLPGRTNKARLARLRDGEVVTDADEVDVNRTRTLFPVPSDKR